MLKIKYISNKKSMLEIDTGYSYMTLSIDDAKELVKLINKFINQKKKHKKTSNG